MNRGEIRLMDVGDEDVQTALAVVALSDRRLAHVWLFAPPFPNRASAESASAGCGVSDPIMWAMEGADTVGRWPCVGEASDEQMAAWPHPRYQMGPDHVAWWERPTVGRKLVERIAPLSEPAEPVGPFSWKGLRAASEYRTLLGLERAPRADVPAPVNLSSFDFVVEGDDITSDVRALFRGLVEDGLSASEAVEECGRRLPDYFGLEDTALLAWYALGDEAKQAGLSPEELRSLVGKVRLLLVESDWQGVFKTERDRECVRGGLLAWVTASESS